MMKAMTTGLFLGRFQPFHKGHLAAILESAGQVDKLYVGIGSAQVSREDRNPFSGEERLEMVQAATKDIGNIEIILIPDIPDHDDEWVEYLEERYPKFNLIFTGNEYTRELFEMKGYKVMSVTMIPDLSATEVRSRIKSGNDWRSLVPWPVQVIIDRIGAQEVVR